MGDASTLAGRHSPEPSWPRPAEHDDNHTATSFRGSSAACELPGGSSFAAAGAPRRCGRQRSARFTPQPSGRPSTCEAVLVKSLLRLSASIAHWLDSSTTTWPPRRASALGGLRRQPQPMPDSAPLSPERDLRKPHVPFYSSTPEPFHSRAVVFAACCRSCSRCLFLAVTSRSMPSAASSVGVLPAPTTLDH